MCDLAMIQRAIRAIAIVVLGWLANMLLLTYPTIESNPDSDTTDHISSDEVIEVEVLEQQQDQICDHDQTPTTDESQENVTKAKEQLISALGVILSVALTVLFNLLIAEAKGQVKLTDKTSYYALLIFLFIAALSSLLVICVLGGAMLLGVKPCKKLLAVTSKVKTMGIMSMIGAMVAGVWVMTQPHDVWIRITIIVLAVAAIILLGLWEAIGIRWWTNRYT